MTDETSTSISQSSDKTDTMTEPVGSANHKKFIEGFANQPVTEREKLYEQLSRDADWNLGLGALGGPVRTFDSGATRDSNDGKYDYEAFLCPLVIMRFGEYMHKHRVQSDGTLRDGDNWQKGIPTKQYMKSLWRHFHDLWIILRGYRGDPDEAREDLQNACCAIIFNVQGILHNHLTKKCDKI